MRKETKWALVSSQGTAAAETCLCSFCFLQRGNREMAIKAAHKDVDLERGWHDVTENDACECTVCMRRKERGADIEEALIKAYEDMASTIKTHTLGSAIYKCIGIYCSHNGSVPDVGDNMLLSLTINQLVNYAEEIRKRGSNDTEKA